MLAVWCALPYVSALSEFDFPQIARSVRGSGFSNLDKNGEDGSTPFFGPIVPYQYKLNDATKQNRA